MNFERHSPGYKHTSSSGGTVTYTATGFIHTAGKRYAGESGTVDEKFDSDGNRIIKRGTGQPRKTDITVNVEIWPINKVTVNVENY